MPQFAQPIPETYLTVSRRVARSAVTRLLTYFNIPNNTKISIIGDSQQVLLWASDDHTSKSIRDVENTKFSQHGLLEVTAKEEPIDAFLLANPLNALDQPPVFYCPHLPITVFPYKTRTKLTLSCVYRAENRERYTMFYQDLLKAIAMTNSEIMMELNYKMILPKFIIAALKHSHELQEHVAPYGIEFLDWLNTYSNGHITFSTQRDGSDPTFVVDETVIGVQGWLTDTVPPEGERKESGANYEVSFDFVLEYDKPDQWCIHMPLVIHNQLTDEAFHPIGQYNLGLRKALRPASRYWFDMIHQTHNEYYRAYPNNTRMLRLPTYDEWDTKNTPVDTLQLYQMLITLDPEDPRLICNLYDFELLVTFSKNLKRYFNVIGDKVLSTKHSVVSVQLYEDNVQVSEELLMLDEENNIRSIIDLDLRKTYHVRMSFLLNWTLLDESAIRLLTNMPFILDEFLTFQYYDYEPKYLNRTPDAGLQKFMAEFYKKYGRFPTEEEIDRYFASLHPLEQKHFFGTVDYKTLMKDWVEKRRVGNTISHHYSRNAQMLLRYTGLFTVVVDRKQA